MLGEATKLSPLCFLQLFPLSTMVVAEFSLRQEFLYRAFVFEQKVLILQDPELGIHVSLLFCYIDGAATRPVGA